MNADNPQVGEIWRSKDKRDNGRVVVVVDVSAEFVYIRRGVLGKGRLSRVRRPLTRLYERGTA